MLMPAYQKRFPSVEKAVEFLDSAGWCYEGRKGWLRTFDVYTGCEILRDGDALGTPIFGKNWIVKLSTDGYAVLVAGKGNDTVMTGYIPSVWPSLDYYHDMVAAVETVNERLRSSTSGLFVEFSSKRNSYPLFKGDELGSELIEVLKSPWEALRSTHNLNPLSEQALQELIRSH